MKANALVVGSFNYTKPANLTNDENILVIGDHDETDPAVINLERQLGAYALTEVDRIWDTHASTMEP